MIRRPPRSTLDRSSAASDVYKRQGLALHQYDDYKKIEAEDGLYKIKSRKVAMRHRLHIGTIVSDAMMKVKFMTGGYVAVSYTHLRAHETVLDLVCRLLLEKKTKSLSRSCINDIKK